MPVNVLLMSDITGHCNGYSAIIDNGYIDCHCADGPLDEWKKEMAIQCTSESQGF